MKTKIKNFFRALFHSPKKNVETIKRVYLQFVERKNQASIYRVVSSGFFIKFFNALTGKCDQKVFSSKEEIKDFCENKLPDWMKSDLITILFLCKIDSNKPATQDNTEVIIEDWRNRFILRESSLNNNVEWGCYCGRQTFILTPA